MEDDEECMVDEKGIVFSAPHFLRDGKPFHPMVCKGEGGNGVMVHLDGTLNATLDWKEAHSIAREAVDQGFAILWNIDLGLFDRLSMPLSDASQFQTLLLGLHHLRDGLWKEFQEATVGLCIYEGVLPDAAQAEYLILLAANMPDALPLFVCIDPTNEPDLLVREQRLALLKNGRFHLAVRGAGIPLREFAWQEGRGTAGAISENLLPLADPDVALGVCITDTPSVHLSRIMAEYEAQGVRYKAIHEENLIVEWDGLETLVVDPACVTPEGLRKLRGFEAAGGIIQSV